MTLPAKPFKVVCTTTVEGRITEGKTYTVNATHKGGYAISKCDDGVMRVFPKEYFREVR